MRCKPSRTTKVTRRFERRAFIEDLAVCGQSSGGNWARSHFVLIAYPI
jgi:hypothetical protein